ncbi:NUDIX hydrolase [Terrarubrum flagellatum]|uniref:NUDIX hydrolase n=1 Tax=Terrirubrum flagellatum TaxID=2895980 RepID=UPI003144D4A5
MNLSDDAIVEVSSVDARVTPFDWAFPRDHRSEIDANWARMMADKPKMFNGRVLLQHHGELVGDVFVARYFETDYADFIGWIKAGHPGVPLRNGFSMAALRARDGAFLLGEMAAHTVNAGRIYFAAGTPDRDDIREGGVLDLAGSAERELCEETGLQPNEVAIGEGWAAVAETTRIAFMRPCRINLPAEEARRVMLDRIARQDEPELSGIHIARHGDQSLHERMPDFMRRYLDWVWAKEDA